MQNTRRHLHTSHKGKTLLLGFTIACSFSLFSCSDGSSVNNAVPPSPEPSAACILPKVDIASLLVDETLRSSLPDEVYPVYFFSQSSPSPIDPQLENIDNSYSIRTTNQWGNRGTTPEEYDVETIKALQSRGVKVILGLTASVIFQDQFESQEAFLEVVTRDASNSVVPHFEIVPNAYRGNIAAKKYRDLILENAKVLIDVGADGIFFDEVDAGYSRQEGNAFIANEGFDDFHEQDFVAYFCNKYPDMNATQFSQTYDVPQSIALNCAYNPCNTAFSMKAYFENKGGFDPDLPLMQEWGISPANKSNPTPTQFVDTYNIVYWADIVRRVRQYARTEYDKDILITSNGLFPFVDFQSVGLYPWNSYGPARSHSSYVPFVPVDANRNLDASHSFLAVFAGMRSLPETVAGPVPVNIFIDWPTTMMDDYYQFSIAEKRDYFRKYAAETYASGIRFAWHLRADIPGDPTAAEQDMLDWFLSEADFYRRNAALFIDVMPSQLLATANGAAVSVTVTEANDGSKVVHVINNEYDDGFSSMLNTAINLTFASNNNTISLLSPELDGEVALQAKPIESGGMMVSLPDLQTYAVIKVSP